MIRKTSRKARTNRTKSALLKRVNEYLLYDHIHNFPHKPFLPKQNGGGIVTLGTKQFEYIEHAEDDGFILITGSTLRSKDVTVPSFGRNRSPVDSTMPCFILKIHTETRTTQRHAEMASITRGTNCSLDGTATSVEIVRAVVQLAKEKGAKWIDFTDTSSICKDNVMLSQATSLADYYFLTRGKTWYETIFPFIPDERFESIITYHRELIQDNAWSDVIQYGKQRFRKQVVELLRNLPVNLSEIDVNAPGSVMEVLRRVPVDKRCYFFYTYSRVLIEINSIGSLFGSVWYLPLSDDYQRNVIATTDAYESVTMLNRE